MSVFGKSWVELMDALQNGTELPKIRDGSSGVFTYLSCQRVPTDPKVQDEYDENFRQQLGRDPEIGDYAGGSALRLKDVVFKTERQFPPKKVNYFIFIK
jgi:hypothetical protein